MHTHQTLQLLSPLVMLAVALVLTGCSRGNEPPVFAVADGEPAPTVSAAFEPRPVSTIPPLRRTEEPIRVPTRSSVEVEEAPNRAEARLIEIPIYNDSLNKNWSLENSIQMTFEPRSTIFAARGRYAVAAKPTLGEGTLFFTLNQSATEIFRRNQVQALRFRLSGGANVIDYERFAVTIVGSNDTPYWKPNDNSVRIEGRVTDGLPIFSETLLVFLGVNKDIPARQWVQIDVWLDDLLYDPDYEFVTGFYFKADRRDVPEFFIDEVSLLMLDTPTNP